MKKTYISLKPFNNKVFYNNNVFSNKSQARSFYLIAAKELLAKNNIVVNTIDILTKSPTHRDIYVDIPYPWDINLWIRIILNRHKNILYLVEPPIVNPFSYMKILHIFFTKIYTWKDDLIDNVKYFKYHLPKAEIKSNSNHISFTKKKNIIMMAGNSLPFVPFQLLTPLSVELYTERIKAIDFFNNYPADFALYGRGWNKPQRRSIKQRLFGYKKYAVYKGNFSAHYKQKMLSQYKFALCFENSQVPGYISEKIFDCFKANCVPIYKGAPNIDKYIPRKCYIDMNDFNCYHNLYRYLITIKEPEYITYIQNIQNLMNNSTFQKKWSKHEFANIFLQSLDINESK